MLICILKTFVETLEKKPHLALLLTSAMDDDSIVRMSGQIDGRLLPDPISRAGDQNRSFER